MLLLHGAIKAIRKSRSDATANGGITGPATGWVCALIVLLYFVITALASRRQLWHDELYTYYIATAPSWRRLWEEIPLDLNPPLEYVLVRASTFLFGQSAYAARFPSVLAFLAGSLCLFRFTGNRLNGAYGVLAMLTLWASPFFYYATEARPYALAMEFLGATLLCWQRAIRPDRSTGAVSWLAVSVSGMMLSHLMAIIYIAPFCLAELVRALRVRKFDRGLWYALLLPCVIPFIFLRLMSRFEISVFPPAFQASLGRAAESYYGTLRLEALPLVIGLMLALILAAGWKEAEPRKMRRIDPVECALIGGFLAVPLAVNLVLMPSHGAYFDRYALPVEFGYALVFVSFLASRTGVNRVAALTASCVLLLFVCAFNLGPGLKPSVWARRGLQARPRQLSRSSACTRNFHW